jgi:hypothetical protein
VTTASARWWHGMTPYDNVDQAQGIHVLTWTRSRTMPGLGRDLTRPPGPIHARCLVGVEWELATGHWPLTFKTGEQYLKGESLGCARSFSVFVCTRYQICFFCCSQGYLFREQFNGRRRRDRAGVEYSRMGPLEEKCPLLDLLISLTRPLGSCLSLVLTGPGDSSRCVSLLGGQLFSNGLLGTLY